MAIVGGMTTTKRAVLHTIRELADAALMCDGDTDPITGAPVQAGEIQIVCIVKELAKYMKLCGTPLVPYVRPMEVIGQRWQALIERPRGRMKEQSG